MHILVRHQLVNQQVDLTKLLDSFHIDVDGRGDTYPNKIVDIA